MTKKFLLKLHLYLSLPLGVVIMLICLSGATLVFKNEIRNALEMPKVIAPHAKSVKVAYIPEYYLSRPSLTSLEKGGRELIKIFYGE